MLHDENIEKISEVFCGVFETLAFMFGDLVPKDELPQILQDGSKVSISFSGDATGSVVMMVPQSMSAEIAANVLGLEPDDEGAEDATSDALKELLNVVCGQLLTMAGGSEPVIDLTVPSIEPLPDGQWRAMYDDEASLAFNVEDEPVLLKFEYAA